LFGFVRDGSANLGAEMKPEALRLADNLFNGMDIDDSWSREQIDLAAAELRRLHEVNQELLEALKSCLAYGCMTGADWVTEKAQIAIVKAEEKK
jgi:hypothetical protein